MLSIRFNLAGLPETDERYVSNPDGWFDNEFGEEYIVGDRDLLRYKGAVSFQTCRPENQLRTI